jgi:hypothetical protein
MLTGPASAILGRISRHNPQAETDDCFGRTKTVAPHRAIV